MIKYYNRNRRYVLFALFAAVCLGCTSSKVVGDPNLPAHDSAAPAIVKTADVNKIDAILAKLDQKSREIKTYETKIVYLRKEPVLESETLRSGMLYYINDEKSSKLRINFTKQLQDNEPVPNYREEYLFDGVNLTRADYRQKNVEYRQLTDANKPLNAFDLASRYLPMVGFTKADKLRGDFEISLAAGSANTDELLLKTKPGSQYLKDYAQIRFWIDKSSSMPVRMEATSPQDDISDIRLENARSNKPLSKNIFSIEVPADFSKNVVPLKKDN
jgi:outer membrane lipoprotein-sorting protein